MKHNIWLWPNRKIGKKESGEMREEHNAVVNDNANLLEALQAVADAGDPDNLGFCNNMSHAEHAARLTLRALRR